MIKNAIKFLKRIFLYKINKIMQKKTVAKFMFLQGCHHLNRIQNFVTLWKMIKSPSNFAVYSFSIIKNVLGNKKEA